MDAIEGSELPGDVARFRELYFTARDREAAALEARKAMISATMSGGCSPRSPMLGPPVASVDISALHRASFLLGDAATAFEAGIEAIRDRYGLKARPAGPSSLGLADVLEYLIENVLSAGDGKTEIADGSLPA